MAAAVALVAASALSAGLASAAAPRVPVGSVPRLPPRARVLGALSASHPVTLTLSLTSRAPLLMARMASEVSTPGSPLYRRYLSVAQFAARFGATPAHIAAVRAGLHGEGLHVASVQANRLTLEVSGPAARVQDAFATHLARVRLADGAGAFADRGTPSLPAAIARDVDAVVGLNTLVAPRADNVVAEAGRPTAAGSYLAPRASGHVATGGPQPCAAATAATASLGGYTADTIAAAYNFSGLYAEGDAGAGQSIDLYELETLNPSDVAAFQSCYGTRVPVHYIKVGNPQTTATDEESALDAEQLISLAPGATINVYEAPDTAAGSVAGFARIVSENRAHTVSTSWGACESRITLDFSDMSLVRGESKLFEEAAIQGQSILSATGDTGSAGCFKDTGGHQLAVQDPSSQPFATGVGGTSLYTIAGGRATLWNPAMPGDPVMQSVWNDGELPDATGARQPAASTGGISGLWAMPGYQRRAARLGVINRDSSGTPCHSSRDCREVPDVSADGDPVTGYVVYVTAANPNPSSSSPANVGQWTLEGGTSAAAPLWAALTADADALPSCRGAPLGFENPDLYQLAGRQSGDLTDVTAASPATGAGNNDALGSHRGLYPVTAGYDMTTGLGTPDAAAVAAGLCGLRAPVYTVTVATPRHPKAVLHTRFTYRLRGTDSGKLALTYRARGLPAGLKISKHGVISGRARRLGGSMVRVTATDHATNTASVTFPISVLSSPARLSRSSLTNVARRLPRLAFTVTKGRYAPRVRSVTVRVPRGLTFGGRGRGIHLSHGRHRVRFHATRLDRALTITFRSPQTAVRVAIERPTLFADPKLARTARHRHGAKATVAIKATDAHRRISRFTVRLRLER